MDEINKRTVIGLKAASESEVGIRTKKRTDDTRIYTDAKEVTSAPRKTRKSSTEVHRLEGLGDAPVIQRGRGWDLRSPEMLTFEL